MNIIKKYIFLVIPCAIALVGIIFVAVAFMINSGVKKNMDESLSLSRKVSSQVSRTPSSKQAAIEEGYQKKHEEDAKRIANLVAQSTMRELVSYKIFPKPKDTSRQIFKDFGADYRTKIDELVTKINAGDAPSEKEIQIALSPVGGGRGTVDETELIVDALCSKRAESYSVYVNPKIFKWYELWNDYQYVGLTDAINDCWFSQVAYWVYSDVVDTVAQVNGDSKSIYISPVKRIVGVNFTTPADAETQAKNSGGALDIPVYVSEQSAPILAAETWTTRESNEKIDVIHFSLSVVLSADKVSDFLKELCSEKTHKFSGWRGTDQEREFKHNQISILSSNIVPVDSESVDNQYYRYGGGTVVQWTGTCEYIFVRDSYDVIKPDSIKEKIGQAQEN